MVINLRIPTLFFHFLRGLVNHSIQQLYLNPYLILSCFQIQYAMPTILASCVENMRIPVRHDEGKRHLTGALWLHCGALGMRMWMPLFPKEGDRSHSFMSKRIMLPVQVTIYPLGKSQTESFYLNERLWFLENHLSLSKSAKCIAVKFYK